MLHIVECVVSQSSFAQLSVLRTQMPKITSLEFFWLFAHYNSICCCNIIIKELTYRLRILFFLVCIKFSRILEVGLSCESKYPQKFSLPIFKRPSSRTLGNAKLKCCTVSRKWFGD